MLTIKNLSLYITKDLRPLLEHFDFSLLPGQKTAIIGEEGNGKSTLLKAIAEPEAIQDYVEISGEINRAGELIGYLPQALSSQQLALSTAAFFHDKINWEQFDYTEYYDLLAKLRFPEERICDTLTLSQLSGGEKIKLQLLRELVNHPTVLLLDEPTNDLDLESVEWLEQFLLKLPLPVLFVSHDELLLERCSNSIIHLEQLLRKKKPHYTISGQGYRNYVTGRENRIEKQTQLARKEREEYQQQMERYRRIYEQVQRDLRGVSRQAPGVAKNLKDKMHTVKSMGKRFERQKEEMTAMPDFEDSILARFDDHITVPRGKVILDYTLPRLKAGDILLAQNIHLKVTGPEKIGIIGHNGCGKTTFLCALISPLQELNLSVGYMPQNYSDLMEPEKNALDFLCESKDKETVTRARTYLGGMKFTAEEMFHPLSSLSGGQRAKIYFARMILHHCQVLLLDEPTRNLSPLSGPEIRNALKSFGGCIISVSHDRKYLSEVCDKIYELTPDGLIPVYKTDR